MCWCVIVAKQHFFLPNGAVSPLISYRIDLIIHCSTVPWSYFFSVKSSWELFLSNPKHLWPWPFRLMGPPLLSSEQFHIIKCIVLTVVLSLAYNNVSTVTTRRKNSCEFHLKKSKHCFDIDSRIRLLSIVNNRGIHRTDTFLTLNLSCKILIAVPYDTLTASATSRILVRQSARIMSWTFPTISSVTTSAGWPGRFSSKTDVWPCLNSLNQNLTVVIDGVGSP